jgi:hypothetical protein
MRDRLLAIAIYLFVLSCAWMFGALLKYGITGTLFATTFENWQRALWVIFGSGFVGVGLAFLLRIFTIRWAPPPIRRDVKTANRTANG